jgi:hypothetical protein
MPSLSLYSPRAHCVQIVLPFWPAAAPDAHGKQEAEEVAPRVIENVPAGQDRQLLTIDVPPVVLP